MFSVEVSGHSLMISVSALLFFPQGDRGPVGPTGPVGEKGPMVSANCKRYTPYLCSVSQSLESPED